MRLPRVCFTVRGMMVVVAVVAILVLIEWWLVFVVMTAHSDATWSDRVVAVLGFHGVGLGILGLVWHWRRFARYD